MAAVFNAAVEGFRAGVFHVLLLLLFDISRRKEAAAKTFRRRSGKTKFPIFLKGFLSVPSLNTAVYTRMCQFMAATMLLPLQKYI